uniref:Gamma-aminobutyric acid receptor subunit alpha-6 n=1 Tax=Macrostomum lignano TaxID=282301 RepID=A0A1I8FV63_9PLAT
MLFNSGSLQHPLVCLAIILALPIGSPCSAMLYTAGVNHTEMTKNITETLNRLLDNYDKNLRPDFDAQPVTVRINMNNRSVGPISEKSMIFSFDCYFRQEWMDARLTFPTHHNFSHLQLNEKMLRDIWKPDTYFVNGMGSYLHNITSPNVLFRINSTGHILYSMRLTIKANCPMNLLKFPMDTQVCPLVVSSHGYTEADVVYEWSKGDESIQLNKDLLLSQFDLRSESAVLCLGLCDKVCFESFRDSRSRWEQLAMMVCHKFRLSTGPTGIPISRDTLRMGRRGSFSALMCHFEFERHMGYFLLQLPRELQADELYLPCSLLVVLSWVGFWINREATSDRIALSITTVLTMTFLGMDNRQDLPRVSYGTALDWYVGMCFAQILATIIEFASVHYFTKHGSGETHVTLETDGAPENGGLRYGQATPRMQRPQPPQLPDLRAAAQVADRPPSHDSCPYAFLNCIKGSSKYKELKLMRSTKTVNSVSRIDEISKILFPALFALFNLGYWTLYLKVQSPVPQVEKGEQRWKKNLGDLIDPANRVDSLCRAHQLELFKGVRTAVVTWRPVSDLSSSSSEVGQLRRLRPLHPWRRLSVAKAAVLRSAVGLQGDVSLSAAVLGEVVHRGELNDGGEDLSEAHADVPVQSGPVADPGQVLPVVHAEEG